MKNSRRVIKLMLASCFVSIAASAVLAQDIQKPYEPVEGQPGRDVVWVPTPHVLVEKMLDMARVTPQDYVMDLGSGDGRNVIAAAKRGARALGVEYNPDMVELSRRIAAREGVADTATFVQGDMYEADISRATILALFLLPENLRRLTPKFLALFLLPENLNQLVPKFLDLTPGSRIVVNGFEIDGWKADEIGKADGDCDQWCTAYLYIVPARVAGTWRLPSGRLRLEQKFQELTGTLSSGGTRAPITNGQLRGDRISFTVGGADYVGRVNGDTMSGDLKGSATGDWRAVRKTASQKLTQRP